MSVRLESKDGTFVDEVSNGTWSAIIACARAYQESVPAWNGCHDGQEWTPEQLLVMADRLDQAANQTPVLRELAARGGVQIS